MAGPDTAGRNRGSRSERTAPSCHNTVVRPADIDVQRPLGHMLQMTGRSMNRQTGDGGDLVSNRSPSGPALKAQLSPFHFDEVVQARIDPCHSDDARAVLENQILIGHAAKVPPVPWNGSHRGAHMPWLRHRRLCLSENARQLGMCQRSENESDGKRQDAQYSVSHLYYLLGD